MRLVCPSCGAMHSAEAWLNDSKARASIQLIAGMPGQVQDLIFPYLGLFRKGKNGLSWPRAHRLIGEVARLVETGTVQWDGGEVRPCPPHVWAQAINAVLGRRPTELDNHNYLRHTAWSMAKDLAAASEREAERRKTARNDHVPAGPSIPQGERGTAYRGEAAEPGMEARPAGDAPASEEDRQRVLEMLRKFTKRL